MMRIGQGYDVHRLVEGRPLILCGITVPHSTGLDGHSDADVALHALTDALLGAAALGDIGALYPDTSDKYLGIDSRVLLRDTVARLHAQGYNIVNVDVTIIAQRPKLRPYIDAMRANVAADLAVALDAVSVKATTTEGLGFAGRQEGIAALTVALISKGFPTGH